MLQFQILVQILLIATHNKIWGSTKELILHVKHAHTTGFRKEGYKIACPLKFLLANKK